MSSLRRWLPGSYRRREEEVRARGVVAVVTGRDVGLPPMTDEEVRDLAAGLVVETALPLLAGHRLLVHAGDAHQLAADLPSACRAWHDALVILDDLRHPDVEDARRKLAGANEE